MLGRVVGAPRSVAVVARVAAATRRLPAATRRLPRAQFCAAQFCTTSEPTKSLEAVCAEYGVAESLVLEAATSAASPPVTGEAAERRLRFLRRIGVEDVGDAARRHPALLVYDVRTQVAPRVEYLLSLGVTEPGALVARAPALLGRDDLHTKVAILQALGVTRIAWWLQTNPGVLEVDIDAQIKPAVDALREVPRLDVARVLSRQPQVLARGYGDGVKLRERLAWLRDELGLTQPGRAVSLHPNLLTYSVEHNLLPRVEWLRSSGFPDPALVIARNPAIASRSIERALEPIFQYVTGPMGRSVDEVANFAHVFSYSLDFIRRRHLYLESDGRNLGSKYTLKRILECSDYHFATRYAKHPDLRDGKTVSYDRKDEMLDEYDAWHPANEPAAADGGGEGGGGEGEGGDGGEGEGEGGGASAGAAPLARRPIPLRLSERAYMKNARKVVAAQKVEEDVARMRQTVREALEEAGYPQQPTPAPDMYDEHGDVKGYPY